MAKRLFENFLDDPKEYRACVALWEKIVTSIKDDLGKQGNWHRWQKQTNENGTPIEPDGNPIFDGHSEELDRAFTIIQFRPKGNEIELIAHLKEYYEEYYRDVGAPRDELILVLSLSEESLQMAEDLLRKWLNPKTTLEEVRDILEHLS